MGRKTTRVGKKFRAQSSAPRRCIFRHHNMLLVPPTDAETEESLHELLSYNHIDVAPSVEMDGTQGSRVERRLCYTTRTIRGEQFIMCAAGALGDIKRLLHESGYSVRAYSRTGPTMQDRLRMWLDPAKLPKRVQLRGWQRSAVDIFNEHRTGQIETSTGSGKTFMCGLLPMMAPKASFLFVSFAQEAVRGLYNRIAEEVPSCAYYNHHDSEAEARVVCCTTGKLESLLERGRVFDYLVIDEKHRTTTERQISQMVCVKSHKIFALSANIKDRLDGADRWADVLMGPRRLSVSYDENVAAGNVVPIEVRWRACEFTFETSKSRNLGMRDLLNIARNHKRNEMIIEDAQRYPDGQVLIIVKTLEHALRLGNALQCPVAYRSVTGERWADLKSMGLVPDWRRPITKQALHKLTDEFEQGKIRLAVATSVWNESVDFRELNVLIRADGQASPIASTQIPGRASRTSRDGSDKIKQIGIIHDYQDRFADNYYDRHLERRKTYKRQGWEQLEQSQWCRSRDLLLPTSEVREQLLQEANNQPAGANRRRRRRGG